MQIPATLFLRVLLLLMLATGCATSKYVAIDAAGMTLGQMRVNIGEGWLRAPSRETPEERSSPRTLSREHLSLDRLMLIPSVRQGQSIFRSQSSTASLPLFDLEMNLEQIADLVGQSMQQALWNGSATVNVSNVRGHGFLGTPGFLFDLGVEMSGGPNHKGFAGGFVHDERLYVNIFTAEAPAHFNQHQDAARHVIESVSVRLKTIGVN